MGKAVCDGMQSVILHQGDRDAIVQHAILRRWFFPLNHICEMADDKMGKAVCMMHNVILDQGASKRCNCASCGEREASVPSSSFFFACTDFLHVESRIDWSMCSLNFWIHVESRIGWTKKLEWSRCQTAKAYWRWLSPVLQVPKWCSLSPPFCPLQLKFTCIQKWEGFGAKPNSFSCSAFPLLQSPLLTWFNQRRAAKNSSHYSCSP